MNLRPNCSYFRRIHSSLYIVTALKLGRETLLQTSELSIRPSQSIPQFHWPRLRQTTNRCLFKDQILISHKCLKCAPPRFHRFHFTVGCSIHSPSWSTLRKSISPENPVPAIEPTASASTAAKEKRGGKGKGN